MPSCAAKHIAAHQGGRSLMKVQYMSLLNCAAHSQIDMPHGSHFISWYKK